jgi:hypothetical protein
VARAKAVNTSASYGRLERLLHRFAFATPRAQLGLAGFEQWLFRGELRETVVGPPLFVSALPRAGTTMLHELLAGCPEFATHTWRDMPFVLCPMLWRSFAGRRRPSEARERAHGDGILIGLDSPAALEEMLWMAHWPERYRARPFAPWPAEVRPAFDEHYAAHRTQIVALRARQEVRARRYLAKNNLHVARLPTVWASVPDATVVVPFREPLQQAASLLRQHERFLALHHEDAFARRYMAGTGHFEFGADLRAVDFGGWLAARPHDPLQLSFWVEYWVAAYRHLLDGASDARLVLVDFARLAASRDVGALAARLGLADGAPLRQQAQRLRPLPERRVDDAGVAPALRDAARATFTELQRRAL